MHAAEPENMVSASEHVPGKQGMGQSLAWEPNGHRRSRSRSRARPQPLAEVFRRNGAKPTGPPANPAETIRVSVRPKRLGQRSIEWNALDTLLVARSGGCGEAGEEVQIVQRRLPW